MPKNEFYKYDFALIIAVTLTVSIGILTIYSAGFDPILKVNNGMYSRQILWFLIGFIAMLIMTVVNYSLLGEISPFIYGAVLFVLILTSFFGSPIRNTRALINAVMRAKPATSKGRYVKKVNIASTMSPGILLDEMSLSTGK